MVAVGGRRYQPRPRSSGRAPVPPAAPPLLRPPLEPLADLAPISPAPSRVLRPRPRSSNLRSSPS
jgi:hypothetical protein